MPGVFLSSTSIPAHEIRRARWSAIITPRGKAATDALDAAREEMALAMFRDWRRRDFDDLARLMRMPIP
jgi:hypothetical protein